MRRANVNEISSRCCSVPTKEVPSLHVEIPMYASSLPILAKRGRLNMCMRHFFTEYENVPSPSPEQITRVPGDPSNVINQFKRGSFSVNPLKVLVCIETVLSA